MKLPVRVRKSRSGRVQVFCPNLPGCAATADSEEEALVLLRERIEEYFASTRDEPLGPGVTTSEIDF